MIRVEYEFLCDTCGRQDITCGRIGDPLKRIKPWLWTHGLKGDRCGDCNGLAAKEKKDGARLERSDIAL